LQKSLRPSKSLSFISDNKSSKINGLKKKCKSIVIVEIVVDS